MTSFNYQLRVSQRARRISLNISAKKGLEVIVPPNTSAAIIEKFLSDNKTWIKKNQNLIEISEKPFVAPDYIELLALKKRWDIIYCDVTSLQNKVRLYCEKILLPKTYRDKKKFQQGIKLCLKKIAHEHLSTHLQNLSQLHNLPFEKLTFRVQNTRWGSCSFKKNITLNAALLFMPFETVRYVMIHELCHTKHLNHSKKFWGKIETLMPDYVQHKAILTRVHDYLPHWL